MYAPQMKFSSPPLSIISDLTTDRNYTPNPIATFHTNVFGSSDKPIDISSGFNFDSGISRSVLDTLVSDRDMRESRERFKKKLKVGKDIKSYLSECKNLSAVNVFKYGTCRIRSSVLYDINRRASKHNMYTSKKQLKIHEKWVERRKGWRQLGQRQRMSLCGRSPIFEQWLCGKKWWKVDNHQERSLRTVDRSQEQ